MAAKGKMGGDVIKTAVGLAILGVTIFVVGYSFQVGKDVAAKRK
jgi:hypothetical protein